MRHLSTEEMQLWISGLATMMSVATEAGRNLYGPKYRELDYFVVKHELLSLIPFNNAALGNIVSGVVRSFSTCRGALHLFAWNPERLLLDQPCASPSNHKCKF